MSRWTLSFKFREILLIGQILIGSFAVYKPLKHFQPLVGEKPVIIQTMAHEGEAKLKNNNPSLVPIWKFLGRNMCPNVNSSSWD